MDALLLEEAEAGLDALGIRACKVMEQGSRTVLRRRRRWDWMEQGSSYGAFGNSIVDM